MKFNTNKLEPTTKVNKRFKMCYVDADTPLHSSAIALQQTYLNVTHKESKRLKRFESKTHFGIRGDKIIPFDPEKDTNLVIKGEPKSKWLGYTNFTRKEKGLPEFAISDFDIEELAELKPEFANTEEALAQGIKSIDFTVGTIKKYSDSEDYRLIISGGKGNYRNDYGKTLKYKGQRSDKPILYSELKELMVDKYNKRIIFANGCEAEDLCGWYAKEQEKLFGEDFTKWEACIAFIDKDVKNVYSPSWNYSKPEQGFRIPTKLDCTFELVSQIIAGDPTDNIKGLPTLTEAVTSKFGLRKANGCGKTTGENLIRDCSTTKEQFERAVFAYQSYYGMEPVTFKTWDDNELTWTWLDFMRETAILVKMQEFEGQLYNVEDTLKELGIDYQNEMYKEPEPVLVDNPFEIIDALREDIKNLVKSTKPLKAEKKDLQIQRLETTVEKLKVLEQSLDNFYNKEHNTQAQ